MTLAPARLAVLLWLAAIVACGAMATADTARAQPLVTGVSGLDEFEPLAFDRIKAAGARFVRIWVDWTEVAPAKLPASWQPEDPADPNYDWQLPDQALVGAVQAGLVPVVMIENTPSWAQRCSSSAGENCDPDPTALAQFATAAARRYSGSFGGLPRVAYWQGLNEPNLNFYFNPQFEGNRAVAATLYRSLINAFSAAVKRVDRSNLVLAAGLAPVYVPGLAIGPMRFARELLCMRGRDHFRPAPGNCHGGVHFDIFDIHPYTTGGPTHEGGVNDVELGDLPKLQRLLHAADRAGRIKGEFRHTPLWVGELSWDSKPPDPGGLAMNIETRWVAEALYRSWRAGVKAFFWFSLRDRSHPPNLSFSQTLQSGLYFRGPTLAQDKPKKVLYAFHFPFVSFPAPKGLFFWGRTPNSKPGAVVIQVRARGGWRKATVAHADGAGMFRGVIPSRYGRKLRGSARAVYQGLAAVPFSMKPVPDFPQPPFGK